MEELYLELAEGKGRAGWTSESKTTYSNKGDDSDELNQIDVKQTGGQSKPMPMLVRFDPRKSSIRLN